MAEAVQGVGVDVEGGVAEMGSGSGSAAEAVEAVTSELMEEAEEVEAMCPVAAATARAGPARAVVSRVGRPWRRYMATTRLDAMRVAARATRAEARCERAGPHVLSGMFSAALPSPLGRP